MTETKAQEIYQRLLHLHVTNVQGKSLEKDKKSGQLSFFAELVSSVGSVPSQARSK